VKALHEYQTNESADSPYQVPPLEGQDGFLQMNNTFLVQAGT
jgi:hypothetical protein